MKFIDLFSGIGGFRSGLEKNGHKAIAYSEVDKYAKQSYTSIYETSEELDLGDITKVSNEQWQDLKGKANIIVGGSPCQSFSLAGKRRGFEDTRGTLFFHYVNAVKEVQPEFFIFENVKGMISHDKGETIKTVLSSFNEIGYDIDFDVFNSKYYGVPQNRERIYIVGKRKDLGINESRESVKGKKKLDQLKNWAIENINYVKLLPENNNENVEKRLVDVLEDEVDEKYYLSEEKTKKLTLDQNIGETLAAPVLAPDRINKSQNGRRFKNDGEPMFTLTTQDRHGIAIREATKQGYAVAEQGDSVNVSYPTSKTRRGRVGKQVAQTLQAGEVNQGVVIDDTQGYDGVRYYKGIAPTLRSSRSGLKTIVTPKEESGEVNQGVVINSKICRRCNGKLEPSDLEDYEYVCFECDENFYEFETKDEVKAIIGSTQKNAYVGNGSISPSLTSAMGQGGGHVPMPVYSNLRIRKLTPLECWRLQGFTDEQFYKAKDSGVSNSQLYKQAGNAVTVNVVDAITKELFKHGLK